MLNNPGCHNAPLSMANSERVRESLPIFINRTFRFGVCIERGLVEKIPQEPSQRRSIVQRVIAENNTLPLVNWCTGPLGEDVYSGVTG